MSDTELPPARLMLILNAGPALKATDVDARAAAGDVAAVILSIDEAAPPAPAHLRTLAAPAQQRDAAVLVTDAPALVAKAGLDGLHLRVANPVPLKSALSTLKPASIVGAGGLDERHTAMEAAESGADYVFFGALAPAPEDAARIRALVNWWAELFEVPCVGVAATLDEVEDLAREGADFVALAAALTEGEQGAATVAQAQQRLEQGYRARLESPHTAPDGRN